MPNLILNAIVLGVFAKLRKTTISLSARPYVFRIKQLGSYSTELNLGIFRKSVEEIQVSLNLTIITGTLHEDQYTFLIISRLILLRKRNVTDKVVEKYKKNTFLLNKFFFFENCAVYETEWKKMEQSDRPQMTIWCMCIACWVPKAKNKLPEYITLTYFLLKN